MMLKGLLIFDSSIETFYLELKAQNPLDAPLAIGGLRIETDAEQGVLEIDAPKEIELGPREALRVSRMLLIRERVTNIFLFLCCRFTFLSKLPV